MITHRDAVQFIRDKLAKTLDLVEFEVFEHVLAELESPPDPTAGDMIIGYAVRLSAAERLLAAVIAERDAIVAERDAILEAVEQAGLTLVVETPTQTSEVVE